MWPALLLLAAQIRIPVWTQPGETPQFGVTLEGRPTRVIAVAGPRDPLILMTVLDMTGDLALDTLAKRALSDGIRALASNHYAAVLRAQDGLKVLVDPTGDRKPVIDAILNLPISGKPGLLETVEPAGRLADAVLARNVRVAILYVTDAEVNNYRQDFTNPVVNSSDGHDLSRKFPEALVQEKVRSLEARLSAQQTPLFIVQLKYATDRLSEAYQSGLKVLAEATGGSSTVCRSNAEIADAITRSLNAIASHYSLTVAVPPDVPGVFRVQVTTREGRTASYRTRFVMKGAATARPASPRE